jgi:tetratricopeptide (TPR) repeat protein
MHISVMKASAGRLGEATSRRLATRRATRAWSIVALLVLAPMGACRRQPSAVTSTVDAGPPPTIAWGGCAVVRVGPRCELGSERALTLWIPGDQGPRLTFAADAHALAPRASTPMQDGWQLVLDVPPGTHKLTASRPAGAEIWSLPIGEARLHPEITALVAAGKSGDAAASSKLRALREDPDPAVRAAAEAGYGRVMLARGEMSEAEPALHRWLAGARADSRVSDEMLAGSALVWALAEQQQRFADARTVLAALTTARAQYPEGEAWYAHDEGLVAIETGDPRTALASFRTAARVWEKLSRTEAANDAAGDVALILATLGRFEEAVSAFDRLPKKVDGCAQASLLINRSEAIIQAATRGSDAAKARVAAALSEEQRETNRCLDPRRRLLATLHAARWALATGDRPGTDALLTRLRAEQGAADTLLRALCADVIGRWALLRGDAREALKVFDEEAAIARAGGLSNESFRAEVGAGEALLGLHRRAEAVRRLRAAQALQQRMFKDVPFAEGRGEFLNSHDEGVRYLVDALVDDGAIVEAMSTARLARATEINHAARLDRLSGLTPGQRRRWDDALAHYAGIRRAIEHEATEEWKLPAAMLARARTDRERRAEEARTALDAAYGLLVDRSPTAAQTFPVEAGVVETAFFQGAKGWIAFARTSTETVARRFRDEALDSNAAASVVLEALSAQLRTGRKVVLFPYGRADKIDWHVVTWRGAPLIAKMAVEYGMDLPRVPSRDHPDVPSKRALVVGDPMRDLTAARLEVDVVATALGGWQVTRLDGAAATRDALLAALPAADLFHYAGHAEMSGPGGSTSALLLTGGGRAQIGDLLALPRLPEVVVLSACEAAATPSSMGLAQAMLAAGTRGVVAPTRAVADGAAQAFVVALYQAMARGGTATLPEAFQRAALGAIATDARSFRFLVQ